VLALFVTLPYGKFVHGIYRAAALAKYAAELNPESQSPNSNDNRRGQTEANHHAGKDFRRDSETASE
jgi:hypothetical protein